MSDETSGYTVSLKGDRQNQPWTVVRGQDAAELSGLLGDLTEDLLQQIADVNSLCQGVLNATAGLAPVQRQSAPVEAGEPAQESQAAPSAPPRQRGQQQSGGSSYGRKKAVAGTGGRGGKKPKLSYEEASADCKHGERRRFTKPGADWVAYFCPQPKGDPDTCDANFIDSDDDQES